jgi:hypothetical protein
MKSSMNLLLYLNQLQKEHNTLPCHVNRRHHSDHPRESSSWLRDDKNGIHQSVHDPGNSNGSEQVDGNISVGIGQHVDESNREEWQDVLQIVTMGSVSKRKSSSGDSKSLESLHSPSHTLYIVISEFHFHVMCLSIFWIGKYLQVIMIFVILYQLAHIFLCIF